MKILPQLPYILTLKDVFLTPIYFIVILIIVKIWSSRYEGTSIKKFIFPALFCRIVGCIFLALMYNFYYGYGDTFSYYTGAQEIWEAFIKNPKLAWEIITHHPLDYSYDAFSFAVHSGYTKFETSHYAMFRISGVTGLFCFGSYLPIALIFSLFSFWGTWMIFLVFNEAFPHLRKYISITTLFIPSVIVWTNGILKEPLCMFGLGLCFYTFNNIIKRRKTIINIFFFLFGSIILLNLKSYILYIFLVASCFWLYKSFIGNVSSSLVRLLINGFIYIMIIIGVIYFFKSENNIIQESFTSYFGKAENLQNAMISINKGESTGSAYELPTKNLSSTGLIQSFLLSVNVSFFRPYVWEINNLLMFLNFLESFATILFCIFLLFKSRVINLFKSIKHPLIIFSLVFSLLMAALVGFISFNFGTLVRYKTPYAPFFYTMLVIIAFNKLPYLNIAKNKIE